MKQRLLLYLTVLCVILFSHTAKAQVLKFAVGMSPPLSICEEGVTGNSIKDFDGVEIEYMNELLQRLGYSTADYVYVCTAFSDIFTILSDDSFTASFGGVSIQYARIEQGIKYTDPTFYGGISLITFHEDKSWTFLQVLGYEIPIMVVVTAFILSVFFYFFERKAGPYEDYFWHMMSSIFFVNGVNLERFSTRLPMVAFWFMMLICISTYTAYMTTIQVVEKISNNIQTINDINQMLIGTYSSYHTYLYPYGAKPITPVNEDGTYNDDFNETVVVDYLANGTLNAWALDDFHAKLYEWNNCNLYIVARYFYPINYAVAFPKRGDNSLIENLNSQIILMRDEKGTIERIQDFLEEHEDSEPYVRCEKPVVKRKDRLGYIETYGLFLILIGSYLFSFVFKLISYTKAYKNFQNWLRTKHMLNPVIVDRKIGDDLIIDNLKKVTNELMGNLQESIEGRIQEMEEKVTKFYEILLQEETEDDGSSGNNNNVAKKTLKETGFQSGEITSPHHVEMSETQPGANLKSNIQGLLGPRPHPEDSTPGMNPMASPHVDEKSEKKSFLH